MAGAPAHSGPCRCPVFQLQCTAELRAHACLVGRCNRSIGQLTLIIAQLPRACLRARLACLEAHTLTERLSSLRARAQAIATAAADTPSIRRSRAVDHLGVLARRRAFSVVTKQTGSNRSRAANATDAGERRTARARARARQTLRPQHLSPAVYVRCACRRIGVDPRAALLVQAGIRRRRLQPPLPCRDGRPGVRLGRGRVRISAVRLRPLPRVGRRQRHREGGLRLRVLHGMVWCSLRQVRRRPILEVQVSCHPAMR